MIMGILSDFLHTILQALRSQGGEVDDASENVKYKGLPPTKKEVFVFSHLLDVFNHLRIGCDIRHHDSMFSSAGDRGLNHNCILIRIF